MDRTIKRYSRQTVLPEIGEEGQMRLSQARILCIGAGGLGCPALLYLAAAGVGTIGIVDFDVVDVSNLQRQILFTDAQRGQLKSEAARDALLALNPDITVKAYTEKLVVDNVLSLFAEYDIILDGTDNFQARFLINDAAVKSGKPVVYASVDGFEGQLSVFDAARGPCYRCLYPLPPTAAVPNCAEAGVIGALAGIMGAMQAMEAVKLVVAHAALKPLIGKLLMIESRTMETRHLALPKNPDCPVCSLKPEEVNLTDEPQICAVLRTITTDEAVKRENALFVDVREQHEWDEGHIPDALHVPLSALQENASCVDLPQDRDCIIYCRSGKRSQVAIQILKETGCDNLFNLEGGYLSWSQAA